MLGTESSDLHFLGEDRQGFGDGDGHTSRPYGGGQLGSSRGDGLAQGWTPEQCHSCVWGSREDGGVSCLADAHVRCDRAVGDRSSLRAVCLSISMLLSPLESSCSHKG